MQYPNYETYQKLYGRYLKKGPERFFAKCLPSGRILDVCSGGGQIAQFAIDNGAKFVQMCDLQPDMLNPKFDAKGRAGMMTYPVEALLHDSRLAPFDMITCRQGVNYWFKNVTGEDIARNVVKGGWFVFNTFGNKPSETPTVREYYHDGTAYKEISYMIGNKIHHVQTCTGIPPHFTVFDWIDRQEYIDKLSPYFRMEEVVEGPSSMWYCQKQ